MDQLDRPHDLLHVDSHSDLVIDVTVPADSIEGLMRMPRAELRRMLSDPGTLKEIVSIANFIPLAIITGLVRNVVWLRSDFPYGYYNGPAPGHYTVELGVVEYDIANPRNLPFDQTSTDVQMLCMNAKTVHAKYSASNPNLDKMWPASSCKLRSGSHSDSPVAHSLVEFNLTVITAELPSDLGRLMGPDWILDVDMDFFASSDVDSFEWAPVGMPARMLQQLDPTGKGLAQFNALRLQLLRPLEALKQACPSLERSTYRMATCTVRGEAESAQAINRIVAKVIDSNSTVHWADECSLGTDHSVLSEVTHLLSALSRSPVSRLWDQLSASLVSHNVSLLDSLFTPHGSPVFLPTPAQLENTAVISEQAVCKLAPNAPKLVTSARSANAPSDSAKEIASYMPPEILPEVEWEVLLLLWRQGLFGHAIEGCSDLAENVFYFPGGQSSFIDPTFKPLQPLACPDSVKQRMRNYGPSSQFDEV